MHAFLDSLVTILHFLLLVILLQQGRGGGMGAAFGGASQQVFGGAGAGNFLTKLTEAAAFTFMFTSVLLAGLASNRGPSKYEEAAKATYGETVTSASASASTAASAPHAPPATSVAIPIAPTPAPSGASETPH
jgi:preprotein translocase subunit SecG